MEADMEWLIARYQPVGLFSLKHGEATSTGGKSLLIPTPFAIRMALLDVALRVEGKSAGEQAFTVIHSLRLALRPPRYAAVSALFAKIIKPERRKDADRAMTPTIAFREYIHLEGELDLAFGGEQATLERISPWLAHITYFGKRGSFVQLLPPLQTVSTPEDTPPEEFVFLQGTDLRYGKVPASFSLGLIQRLDEWGPGMTFAKANVYDSSSEGKIKVGKDRIRMDVILPYQMRQSGRGFTLYERFE
jgi:hypothetical protein